MLLVRRDSNEATPGNTADLLLVLLENLENIKNLGHPGNTEDLFLELLENQTTHCCYDPPIISPCVSKLTFFVGENGMLWASRGPQDLFQCLNFRFTNFQDFQKFSQDQIFNYTRSESPLVRRRVGCEISCRSCSESGRSEKSVNRGIREIRQQSLDERCESSASETGQCPFRKSRSTNREILFLN